MSASPGDKSRCQHVRPKLLVTVGRGRGSLNSTQPAMEDINSNEANTEVKSSRATLRRPLPHSRNILAGVSSGGCVSATATTGPPGPIEHLLQQRCLGKQQVVLQEVPTSSKRDKQIAIAEEEVGLDRLKLDLEKRLEEMRLAKVAEELDLSSKKSYEDDNELFNSDDDEVGLNKSNVESNPEFAYSDPQHDFWEITTSKIKSPSKDKEIFNRGIGVSDEVVKEQENILRKIQEENERRREEEKLTMDLIAKMCSYDQQQQQHASIDQQVRGAAAVCPPKEEVAFYENVAVKDKLTSIKLAADIAKRKNKEAMAMERRWSNMLRTNSVVKKNKEKFEMKKEDNKISKEQGARRKSEACLEFTGEKQRASLELKETIAAKEREWRANYEQKTLEQAWETANRRNGRNVVGMQAACKGSSNVKEKKKRSKNSDQ